MGLVSRQWDAVDWACVLCDRRIHNDRASRSANLHQCACPFYSCRAGFFCFGKTSHHPGLSAPLQLISGFLKFLIFPKAKIAVESEEMCECNGHTVNKLSQRLLTADWLAPRECDFTDAHCLLWLAAKLHQGHATGSRDIQYGCILSGQASYV